MEPSQDRWWWLFPDELAPAQQITVADTVPMAEKAARAWARTKLRKEVDDRVLDPALRAVLAAAAEKHVDEQLRIDALAIEPPEQIAARVQARVDEAVGQFIAYGLPWLAARARAKGTSLPGIVAPPQERYGALDPPKGVNPLGVASKMFR